MVQNILRILFQLLFLAIPLGLSPNKGADLVTVFGTRGGGEHPYFPFM